jgi:hypothetical protein
MAAKKIKPRRRLRGPDFERDKRRYVVPELTIQRIARNYEVPVDVWCAPAIPIKRIPQTTKVTKLYDYEKGNVEHGERMETVDEAPDLSLALGLGVLACASLTPEQWRLVGGAEFHPRKAAAKRKMARRRGKRGAQTAACARLRTGLPTRTLVFDIGYPLSCYARVTIRPYKVLMGRGRTRIEYEEMDVGYVLWQLAQAYKQIYMREDEFGVRSHDIGDLSFGSLKILDNIGEIGVDS